MTNKHKRVIRAVVSAALVLPVCQVSGCFSDEDIRTIIADVVTVTLDAAEVAVNNIIDESFPRS